MSPAISLRRLALAALVLLPGRALGAQEKPEEPLVVPAKKLSIRLEGQLQVQAASTSVDSAVGWDVELRRARLTVVGEATDAVSVTLQPDFGRDRVRIRDAVADVRVSDVLTLRAGQFKIPFNGIETVSSKRLLVIERNAEVRGLDAESTSGLLADTHLSARNRGVAAVVRPAGGRWVIQAGGWQGNGEAADDNDAKEVAGRVEYAVLPAGEDRSRPLVVGAAAVTNGYFGEPSDTLQIVDGDTLRLEDAEYATAFEGWVEYGAYLEPGLHVAGNVIAGDNPSRLASDGGEPAFRSFLGLQGWGEYLIVLDGPFTGIAPAFRADRFDPDTDSGDDASLLLTPGLNLYAGKNLKLQANLDVVIPEESDLDTESAFRLQGQALF